MKSKDCSGKLRRVADGSQRGFFKKTFLVAMGIIVFDLELFVGERHKKERADGVSDRQPLVTSVDYCDYGRTARL